ncbi:hypothetical protein L9F63_027370 [Diploptera punctata]|uniref:Protein kinase domain-containing protein n=1 Tax=Diploptera punctata TaxID=6984 RepID=A0AAD8A9M5_DIPPU|nr:hypothetical protein L9F63_027370 [Diploptera punctata]
MARGVTCVWRGQRNPPPVENLTVNYSTCTHDSISCPDFFCDPLEQIGRHICLQDCTDLVVGGNHNPNGVGIMSAGTKAVCTCDVHGTCTCAPPNKGGDKKSKTRAAGKQHPVATVLNTTTTTVLRDPHVSTEIASREASCGAECLVGIFVASLFLFFCSIAGIIYFRLQRVWESEKRQKVYTHNLTHDPAEPLASPDPRTVPDPKWEFPRSRLIIEQTLGEGEFGRVLRARALDIGGISGCTTVAVKTLKENANTGELNDLLSEYQLLKEVTHPNVIRLLGACTTPGAPILAARNVLLAANKICKISDFGLTRDVYEDDAYLKRSKGRVPVKWMALESLADHMYTSKSDVWSFGVLMWELVTLGASPYPGVAVHNLFHLLKAGYRMEKPDNCSIQLYNIMRSCWYEHPQDRPPFKELTATFERMLEDGVEYLDLNPRIVHNRTYFTSPQDLLAKHDEARHNLSLSSTECDIQLSQRDRQKSCSSRCDSSGDDSHLQVTPEDEQRLLSNQGLELSISSAAISKHLYQNELSNHNEQSEEIAKPHNPYLTPIHNNSTVSETSKQSRPQSYLNMDGNLTSPDNDTQQDLLFFSVENTPQFSNESSKVTYF